jgi:uncharacterized membrane protein
MRLLRLKVANFDTWQGCLDTVLRSVNHADANPEFLHESVIMKTMLPVLLLCLACAAASHASAHGDGSTTLSEASGLIALGSASVVVGSLGAVAASGAIVVDSVQAVGGASMVVLRGASEAVSATVRLSGNVVAGASLVAGASVTLVAVSTGYLLVSAGQVLAFIPNEIGRSLLHHSRVGG